MKNRARKLLVSSLSFFVMALLFVPSLASAQVVTQIIDATGDGDENPLCETGGIALDGLGNAYVFGLQSFNAFKITPDGMITEIVDTTSGGPVLPSAIAADALGTVYVVDWITCRTVKITLKERLLPLTLPTSVKMASNSTRKAVST